MDPQPAPCTTDASVRVLTHLLAEHVRDHFAGYAEVELAGASPGPAPDGPRLHVEVREGLLADALTAGDLRGDAEVLVLCACAPDDEDASQVTGGVKGGVTGGEARPSSAGGRPVDVVRVRRAGEIAGAVAESTAGDVPLVLDVRLTRADAGRLLATRGPR